MVGNNLFFPIGKNLLMKWIWKIQNLAGNKLVASICLRPKACTIFLKQWWEFNFLPQLTWGKKFVQFKKFWREINLLPQPTWCKKFLPIFKINRNLSLSHNSLVAKCVIKIYLLNSILNEITSCHQHFCDKKSTSSIENL